MSGTMDLRRMMGLVDRLYESAHAPSLWGDFLGELAAAFQAQGAGFSRIVPARPDRGVRLVECADDLPGLADALWSQLERLEGLAPSASGMVETWRGLAAFLPMDDDGHALVGVVRRDDAPPFASSLREAFDLLIPHMARTLRFERLLVASRGGGGQQALPPRQCEVLALGAQGLRSKEIATRMGLSVRTVEHHFTAAAQRLKTRGRIQTIATAIELGLLMTPGGD